MLFDTAQTQTIQASLDSLWTKTQVISNNMANADTPGFKASNVGFEEVLGNARRQQNKEGREVTAAERAAPRAARYRTRIMSDPAASVRQDGNNVVLEQQQSELWKTYAQYSYLLDRISGHYASINTAITNMKG